MSICPFSIAHLCRDPPWAYVSAAVYVKLWGYVQRCDCMINEGIGCDWACMDGHGVECSHTVGSQWEHECAWWVTAAVHGAMSPPTGVCEWLSPSGLSAILWLHLAMCAGVQWSWALNPEVIVVCLFAVNACAGSTFLYMTDCVYVFAETSLRMHMSACLHVCLQLHLNVSTNTFVYLNVYWDQFRHRSEQVHFPKAIL